MSNIPKGYFLQHYRLQGKNWIKHIPPEEKQALMHEVFMASDCGRLGGRKRAETATRDEKGRFLPTLCKE